MFALPLKRTTQSRFIIWLFLVTGLFLAGTGAAPTLAQQPDSVEVDTTGPESTTQTIASEERKSPGRAVLYSVGGTVLLTPLGGLGLVVGPAFGHFYAEDSQQAWIGTGIRAGGALAFGIGGVLALGAPQLGWGLLSVGALVVAGSGLFDIVTAWHSAKGFNESHDVRAEITPRVGPGGEQVGFAVRVSF